MSADLPVSAAQQQHKLSVVGAMPDAPRMKARQRSKIAELRTALAAAGILTLDEQAEVLALSRSTTWSILSASHKTSGLSADVIIRMLASPRLPALARRTIHEYVQERLAGLYGHSKRRRREFAVSLSIAQLKDFIVDAALRNNHRRLQSHRQTATPVLARGSGSAPGTGRSGQILAPNERLGIACD
jgi:hypothetical protein